MPSVPYARRSIGYVVADAAVENDGAPGTEIDKLETVTGVDVGIAVATAADATVEPEQPATDRATRNNSGR